VNDLLEMTWCSKISDIFNGWTEDDNELPSPKHNDPPESSISNRNNSDFYRHEIEDNNLAVIQHDSPFLEKSDSLTNANFSREQLYNIDYMKKY
jgi:hypothetical protein